MQKSALLCLLHTHLQFLIPKQHPKPVQRSELVVLQLEPHDILGKSDARHHGGPENEAHFRGKSQNRDRPETEGPVSGRTRACKVMATTLKMKSIYWFSSSWVPVTVGLGVKNDLGIRELSPHLMP